MLSTCARSRSFSVPSSANLGRFSSIFKAMRTITPTLCTALVFTSVLSLGIRTATAAPAPSDSDGAKRPVVATRSLHTGTSATGQSAEPVNKPQTTKSTEKKAKMDKFFVYIGTYTNTTSKGIYIYQMDTATGKLTPVGTGPMVASPSFLTISPNHKFLYAANEISDFDGGKTGAISAFSITPKTGELTLLNQKASAGAGPCFVTIDSKGKNVLVANYGSGTVACLPVDVDGKLLDASATIQHTGTGPNAERQEGPHAHSINLDPANHFALAADLGVDKVFVYKFDPTHGSLTANTPPFATLAPGSGPRHLAFHPNGNFVYVINEMKSTVTTFAYDKVHGSLKELGTVSTLPEAFAGSNTTAEVQVHPSGKFLYGSNRGHDSLAIFSIDAATGKLTLVGHESTQGKTPRNFRIDPTGNYLLAANQDTDNVVVFKIDTTTGKLTPTGQILSIPIPVCVKFIPVE